LTNNKTTIKKIVFTKEQLDEIDRINKGQTVPKVRTLTNKSGYTYDVTYNKRFSYLLAQKRLAELYGGLCTVCRNYPDFKVSYDVGNKNQGARLVQRYCEKCFSKWEDRIKRK
jgi:hypothetical protein